MQTCIWSIVSGVLQYQVLYQVTVLGVLYYCAHVHILISYWSRLLVQYLELETGGSLLSTPVQFSG